MKTWLYVILSALGLVLVYFAFAVLVAIFVAFITFILAIMIIAWTAGAKISVSAEGKRVGYIKWFTFYKQEQK
jgi:hypothetical protein